MSLRRNSNSKNKCENDGEFSHKYNCPIPNLNLQIERNRISASPLARALLERRKWKALPIAADSRELHLRIPPNEDAGHWRVRWRRRIQSRRPFLLERRAARRAWTCAGTWFPVPGRDRALLFHREL